MYDLFLLFAVGFAYSAVVMLIAASLGLEPQNLRLQETGDDLIMQADANYQPALRGPLFQAGLGLTLALFYMGFWHFRGATLGMQTWRLVLVDKTGQRPGWRALALRIPLGFAALACAGIGYLWSLFDSEGLALHDRLSGTRVVRLPKPQKSALPRQ